jgi:adenylate cyclase
VLFCRFATTGDEKEMERRLAAIVCADVAGYSRMMGADEAGTHAAFKAHRSAIYPIILNHGGRIVKNTGDGFLLEYPSIVGAVESAIAMQALMAERNNHLPADRVMQFRLGVHMGDMMADEEEVFGDDVNIAVRLETVAAPGGVAVSMARPAGISASRLSMRAVTGSRTSNSR